MRRPIPLASLVLACLAVPAQAGWPPGGLVLDSPGSATSTGDPGLGSGGEGDAIVAWYEADSLGQHAFRVHRRNAAGDPPAGWSAAGVRTGAPLAIASTPLVRPDGAGGAFLVWVEGFLPASAWVLRLAADGSVAPGWPARGIGVSDVAGQDQVVAVEDGAGGVLVAWRRATTGLRNDILLQHLAANGARVSGFPAAGRSLTSGLLGRTDFRCPLLVRDGSSGFWISYTGVGPDSLTAPAEYRVARLTPGGTLAAGQDAGGLALSLPYAEVSVYGTRGVPVPLACDGAGGAFAFTLGANGNLRGFHLLDSPGEDPAWPAGGLVLAGNVSQPSAFMYPYENWPVAAGDGAGGAYVGWRDTTLPARLRATRVLLDGTTPPGWIGGRLLHGEMTVGLVADPSGLFASSVFAYDCPHYNCYGPYTICRFDSAGAVAPGWPDPSPELIDMPGFMLGTGGPEWGPRLVADGVGGVFAFWRSGSRRLQRFVPGGVLGVPATTAAPFALARAWFDRSAGVRASYSLAGASTATLELFDVAGRRRARTRLDEPSGEVTLAPGRALAPGLYFVRLSAVGHTTAAKVVVGR